MSSVRPVSGVLLNPDAIRSDGITVRSRSIYQKGTERPTGNGAEIVPLSVDQMPAGIHVSLRAVKQVMQEVPVSVYIRKLSGYHVAFLVEIIPFALALPLKQSPAV